VNGSVVFRPSCLLERAFHAPPLDCSVAAMRRTMLVICAVAKQAQCHRNVGEHPAVRVVVRPSPFRQHIQLLSELLRLE
jgi:hypothetical protein